ncbi:MAG: hypothetical protein QW802_02325 [Candidatus Altiarchaeota archaeon]
MKTKHNFFGFKLDRKFLISAILLMEILIAGLVYAQATQPPLGDVLTCLICRVFYLIFWATAAIAALVILIAGVKWIGSGDDPSARGAAKGTIVHAIIGLIIVIIAVFLVWWVVGGFGQMGDPRGFIDGCDNECAGG